MYTQWDFRDYDNSSGLSGFGSRALPYLCFLQDSNFRPTDEPLSRGVSLENRDPSQPWNESTNPLWMDPGLNPAGYALTLTSASSVTIQNTGVAPQTFTGLTGRASVTYLSAPSNTLALTDFARTFPVRSPTTA